MIRKTFCVCCSLLLICLAACRPGSQFSLTATAPPTPVPSLAPTSTPLPASTSVPTAAPTATGEPSPTARPLVPNFKHIVVIFFENHEFDLVYHNRQMPEFNRLAAENTILTQYYAITHPSLPNYLAVFGGDTFKITSDCENCYIAAANLPDQIEDSGRTWRAYFQNMPQPCSPTDTLTYVQKHNPFMYFNDIRLNAARCSRSVVPLAQLDTDLANSTLPDFVYIMPNSCVSTDDDFSHEACNLALADNWLAGIMDKLLAHLNQRAAQEPYLVVITWDEGQGDHSCCGLPARAGGRIATLLVSPLAKSGFQDDTPYTHYSLLKTIESSWGLDYLMHAADAKNALITAPWK